MLITAANLKKVDVLTMIWDAFAPGSTFIDHDVLDNNACNPSIALAEAIHARSPDCFNQTAGGWLQTQVETAILCDNYDYVDYMLAHGADINQRHPFYTALAAVAGIDEESKFAIQLNLQMH